MDGATLIKDNLTISALVSRYAKLEKRGNRMACCCPIHGEKTPSCYLDDQKGFFHCFGCGRGGDVIKFAMEVEHLSFPDALEFLADLAGVELPKRGVRGPGRDVIEGLRAVNEAAREFYHQQLLQSKPSMAYLKSRGITENTVRLFKLGYAPNAWDGLLNHLTGTHSGELLQQSGLFKPGRQGRPYDLFRDRIMFPICDAYGNVIAFGGRLMEGDGPKYINSPESPLYVKGRHLYNLHFAKPYLKREPTVVVCEGYMDVIQVYQAGVGGVIACLGTAFTPQQGKLLKRYAERVILNFDGDAAGFKAARASIETFLALDTEVSVVRLPDKQDPDDFIKDRGVDAYREQLAGADGFFGYLMGFLGEGRDIRQDPHAQSYMAREMGGILTLIQDPVVKGRYLERLAESLDLRLDLLEKVLASQKKAEREPPPPPPPPPEEDFFPPLEEEEQERLLPFNSKEKLFLFQVMKHEDYTSFLGEEDKQALPQILGTLFHDRPWVMEFINEDRHQDFETQLEVVPEPYRPMLRQIWLSDAFVEHDAAKMRILVTDLLKQMIKKLVAINKNRLRTLPPTADDKRRALMRHNFQLMAQYHKVG
ncbi:DNA primase [Sulfidibacter corallicola]|uniref:DNA primase n=1 Tax=Sulfidibacter corallicola TaxID=2818388 RepID=A0A8A4U4F0_SULCO|nr:DNA primase [Sulfidibacter corallicola]QTD53625.1 DNA primase [Sulfidibacter corallicola]